MKIKGLLFALILMLFYGVSFSQDIQYDVVWDFGLKTGIKWNNGKSMTIINEDHQALEEDIHSHFNYPSLALAFTFYPKLSGIDLGLETLFGYNQFSGTINTSSNKYIKTASHPYNVIFLKENLKYAFIFSKNRVEYVFLPYVGIGVGFISKGRGQMLSDISVKDLPLNFTNHDEDYEKGFYPLYSAEDAIKGTVWNAAFGLDFEVRTNYVSLGVNFGYDVGLNKFYGQDLSYKYYNKEPRTEKLNYYNSGMYIGLSVKYLFR